MVVTECSKLPENHDVMNEFTDARRLEANTAKREAKRDEEIKSLQESYNRLKEELALIQRRTDDLEKFKDQQGRTNSLSWYVWRKVAFVETGNVIN